MKRIERCDRGLARNRPARAKRIAQGFSPGKPEATGSPCKGDRREQLVTSEGVTRCENVGAYVVSQRLKIVILDNSNKPYLANCVTNSGALSGRGRLITLPKAKALGYGVQPLRGKFDTDLGYAPSPYRAVPYRVFCGLSLELFARPVMNNETVLPKADVTAGKNDTQIESERGQRGSPRRVATISLERRVVSKQ